MLIKTSTVVLHVLINCASLLSTIYNFKVTDYCTFKSMLIKTSAVVLLISLLSSPPHHCFRQDCCHCSLRELMSLIREVNPETRQKLFSFATVYPDPRRGGFRLKDLGQTCSGRRGSDDNITLHSRKINIGDFINVAISNRPRGRSY